MKKKQMVPCGCWCCWRSPAALNVTITAAAEAGSADDPLVTLSYLNETFMDTIMDRVDEKIAPAGRADRRGPQPPASPW